MIVIHYCSPSADYHGGQVLNILHSMLSAVLRIAGLLDTPEPDLIVRPSGLTYRASETKVYNMTSGLLGESNNSTSDETSDETIQMGFVLVARIIDPQL